MLENLNLQTFIQGGAVGLLVLFMFLTFLERRDERKLRENHDKHLTSAIERMADNLNDNTQILSQLKQFLQDKL